MKKLSLLLTLFFCFSIAAFAQAPEAIKYQAMVRDASNNILKNTAVGFRLSILKGSVTGPAIYQEEFRPTSNAFGLVSMDIGTGTTTDDFSAIDWSNGPYFIETAIDIDGGTSYAVMGTSQLLSVPYAMHSNTSNHAQLADSSIIDHVIDDDADPVNEIQVLNFSNDTLYLSNGGQIYLGDYAIDNDADATNEIQALSFNNDTLYLSNGGSVYLGNYKIDTDPDPQNEIQAISFSGDTLYLSNGGHVYLGDYAIDNDDDASNEIQNLALSGNTLSISGGSGTIDLSKYDPTPAYSASNGSGVTATKAFIGPTRTVTITAGQKIMVVVSKSLGTTATGGASDLRLWIGYKSSTATTPSTIGGGTYGLRIPQNTRIPFAMNGVITGLAAGTYTVGMVGQSVSDHADWNSNEYGYITTVILD